MEYDNPDSDYDDLAACDASWVQVSSLRDVDVDVSVNEGEGEDYDNDEDE